MLAFSSFSRESFCSAYEITMNRATLKPIIKKKTPMRFTGLPHAIENSRYKLRRKLSKFALNIARIRKLYNSEDLKLIYFELIDSNSL